MVWFVKVSCPFLKVEYEETTSHPICRKDGIYLDKHHEKKEKGCQGCEILDRDELETVERSNMKKLYAELVTKTKEQLVLGQTPHWMPIDWKENKKLEGAVKKLTEGHNFE